MVHIATRNFVLAIEHACTPPGNATFLKSRDVVKSNGEYYV